MASSTSSIAVAWVLGVVAAVGCSSAPTPRADAARNPPGSPRVGAHVIAFHRQNGETAPLIAPAIPVQDARSTIVVSIGRGVRSAAAAPTDDRGNVYAPLDVPHAYTLYPDSGTELYAVTQAAGGSTTVTGPTPASDEITMAVVEILDGGGIQDVQWNEVLRGRPITSRTVTTTGPATLIAFWWGDAGVDDDKTAVPDSGFEVIDHVFYSGALVQCAVATREVTAAGTYAVTWTATPDQGAQLWLVAIQNQP